MSKRLTFPEEVNRILKEAETWPEWLRKAVGVKEEK